MPVYAWAGRTRQGAAKKGVLEALNEAAVMAQLRSQGIVPGKVKAKPKDLEDIFPFLRPRITTKDLVVFTRQFAVMIDAGLPLVQCLHEDLNLPPVVAELTRKPRGLLLVTGPTGSGKSTTLASIIDRINSERSEHIVTIEDPIEYLHPHKGCLVNQREVGADTAGFKEALKYILRQDPDVVLVGELRDIETMEAALSIAETGHYCLATLHTNSAVQTINRVVDMFPPFQQAQIRQQLSFVLEGVMCQSLMPRANGPGRVLALEVMVPNSAIRALIRDDKIHQLYSAMQVGQDKFGMQTMNQSLAALYKRRLITLDDALGRSGDIDELRNLIGQGSDGGVNAGRRAS